ncbi:MAG: hypothetical protein RBT78_10880 [Kiritimatiellia bacterium]|jgi:hypothetical protein|nr:hypothetical protein [Kiritimatiellia bacterium]
MGPFSRSVRKVVRTDGLVSLTRFATRFRCPGEAATGEDVKRAIALMRRYRSAPREFLGL